jgi:D-alanine transfer protein
MKTPHLFAFLVAGVLLLAALLAGITYASGLETRYVYALAPLNYPQKGLGNALQRVALQQPDLLPLYGSSELRTGGQFNASEIFKSEPTGFTVFPVGRPGADAIIMLQELASAGSAVRGKKIALSISWISFLDARTPGDDYAFNFSTLNATELAFNTDLSFEVRQGAARRMLQYPGTLTSSPLLKFALERLADGSPIGRALLYAVSPLARLYIWTNELQDHWQVLLYIFGRHDLRPGLELQPGTLDWPVLIAKGEEAARKSSTNNSYGADNDIWNQYADEWLGEKNDLANGKFQQVLRASAEWNDLRLLLQAARELGAQPLLLSAPIHGPFFDYRGVSAQERGIYYQEFRQLAGPFNAPAAMFEEHEYDLFFLEDPTGHPSTKGWVYYDQVLDAFYHGSLRF